MWGGAKHPVEWISTSPCFHIKNNATDVCYAENPYKWNERTCIGNDVWLGMRVIVLPGVTIHDGAVIGTGSIVTKDVGPYEIWAGNPARFIRKRFNDETIDILVKSKWWDWTDEDIQSVAELITNPEEFVKEIKRRLEI